MAKPRLVLVGYAYEESGKMVHSTIYETKRHARANMCMNGLPIFPVYRDMNDAPHYRTELTDKDDYGLAAKPSGSAGGGSKI